MDCGGWKCRCLVQTDEQTQTYMNKEGLWMLSTQLQSFTLNRNIHPVKFCLQTQIFFPYASYSNAYWRGYLTNHLGLKGYQLHKKPLWLSSCRKIVKSFSWVETRESITTILWKKQLQMYDVVTGTSKQHIANEWQIKDISGDNIY